MSQQVSGVTSPYLEARVLNLEEQHRDMRESFDNLKEFCSSLSIAVDKIQKDNQEAPISQVINSFQFDPNAVEFKHKLDKLRLEAHEPLNDDTDKQKANSISTTKKTALIPPHLRARMNGNGATSKSVPSDTQNVNNSNGCYEKGAEKDLMANNPPVVNKQVDKGHGSSEKAIAEASPTTPKTAVQGVERSINALSLDQNWRPCYINALAPLSSGVRSNIPDVGKMVTFHADFIHNTFDGLVWSPGLRFVPPPGSCILPNRTYYLLDPSTEPYLPQSPGEHGAKLTAFFNQAPEEKYGDLEQGTTHEDVPMFVKMGNRYMYFGNYSQTRWSDKLDHDTMTKRVPQAIREFWAAELSACSRDAWVTDELKKHFFPKPEYQGRLFATPDDGTTVTSEEEIKNKENMAKDIKKYVEELCEWTRDSNMRVSLIKPDFILEAFDRADVDEPPALRLWWEYLECVNWRKDFYDLLVTLQSRNPAQCAQ